ncbi:MAG: efflux RND transporter periplasmic adaptor subunit, partial [Candidatus Omnitrophica bacterium]|nr:efflux RND transporter periplasmic adaptor subunit [Candidatus Omnitrophota bacterium]
MKRLKFWILICVFGFYSFAQHQHETLQAQKEAKTSQKKIKYWTCGMHPQIKQEREGNCPICNMKLIPVYEEVVPLKEEKGVVKLTPRDISLAGVKSEPVTFRHLFKEIRTVGRIAYDPELYKAEEEFIQAINIQQKLKESQIPEVKKFSDTLVEAARLKLTLQGLSSKQIDELSKQGQPDRSLVISDQESPYVWVYADLYEYE